MLTKEQIAKWREVFITMGIMPMLVNSLPDSDIELMASNFQKKMAIEAAMEMAMGETMEMIVLQEKEKAEHRKKNEKTGNQYDVIPGFKNTIKISKR